MLSDRLRKLLLLIVPVFPDLEGARRNDQTQALSSQGISDDALSRLRARQLASVTRLTPLNAIANVLDVLLTLAVFQSTPYLQPLLIWAAAQLLLWGFATYNWYRFTLRTEPWLRASERAVRRTTIHSAVMAAMWAIPPLFLYTSSGLEQQLFLTAITAGMMCAGGFVFTTLPQAALVFMGILGAASVGALLQTDTSIGHYLILLLLVYLAILAVNILHAAAVFRAHVLADIASEQQNQVISLLLNDFEQSTADVLWEIGQDLRVLRTNTRLNDLFGDHRQSLERQHFPSMIQLLQEALPDDLRSSAHAQFLQFQTALGGKRAFRDLELPVSVNQQLHWWSITAKPTPEGNWRGVIADITHSHQAQQRIWQLAHEDSVTGLANRHWFQNQLEESLRGCRQDNERHALLCIDLDRFKAVNDTFGHDTGDLLLKVVAERLRHHTRSGDLVARTGGDEFAIILRHIHSQQQVDEIAQRLLGSLHQSCQLRGVNVSVGASIGIACVPDDGGLPEEVLKHADLALYQAKGNGRGRAIRFIPAMAERAHSRHRIEQALRLALQKHDITLMYQPQRHIQSGHLVGVEALARWFDPQLGQVSPALFVEVAEETGLIHELGLQVLQQACQYLADWKVDMTLSVNISPVQLGNPAIVAQIHDTLMQYDVPPHRLELEITENVLLGDSQGALEKLQQLRDMGVKIALDDFGTGYSSLAYLRRFPFDKIKIDRSFVREIVNEPSARTIVGAIIDMARALDMDVVAEGVENTESLHILRELGCDIAQGFHIFPPMTAQEFSRTLVRPVLSRTDRNS
ncbi:putative bifunctional diguanylate cyclase/phosphodiesterase [Parathalassolituus penaei]|mgnify:CR=1 FL=1|uniref:EAL domain-containing protein n=1 Tax=Parathalassolituus penaei TaxID=2997323 RepID=A0A9X3EFV2_9GAMM|nr:EAL domain-containing protein [Parathalassolituus penaei]MCY0965965.1 EAL domain-containing protein [Parathalassolituus penaei]